MSHRLDGQQNNTTVWKCGAESHMHVQQPQEKLTQARKKHAFMFINTQ